MTRAISLLSVLGIVLLVGCGKDADGPVDVNDSNLKGHWYGFYEPMEGTYGHAPVLLHLTEELPGVFGLSPAFESLYLAWSTSLPGEVGRWSLDDDALILETQYLGVTQEPQRFRIKELTRNKMVLDLGQAPSRIPDEIVLHRGSSCYASAQWLSYPTYIGATAFGPDGRFHMLAPTGDGIAYAFDHPGQCQPLVRNHITGQAIDVGPDGTVRVARMNRHDGPGEPGIYIQEFSGAEMMANPIAPKITKLSDMQTTYSYPFLSVSHSVDGVPVVTWANGRDVYLWALEGDGWQEHHWLHPAQVTQTPGRVKMQPLPDGGLVGAGMVYKNGEVRPWEDLTEHPEYGAPRVFAYDGQGRLHGVFDGGPTFRGHSTLTVGRLVGDGQWEVVHAGYGEPIGMNVREDGSVDVGVIWRDHLGRAEDLVWVHVDASFEPGGWVGSISRVDTFFAETRDEARYGMIWASFGPEGGVYLGAGAVGPGTNISGALRKHEIEEQEVPRNVPVEMNLSGERPLTVEVSHLGERCESSCVGLECSGACAFYVPGGAVFPVRVESGGESVRARDGVQLPDGFWVLQSDSSWDIDAPLELAEAARLLAEDEFETARQLDGAVPNGEGGFFVLTRGGDRGHYIELRDAEGEPVDGIEFNGTGSSTPVRMAQPLNGQGVVFYGPWTAPLDGYEPPAGVGSLPLVYLNPDLSVRSVVAVPQVNPIPVAQVIADDGSLVALRVNTYGGRTFEVRRFFEDGRVEESSITVEGERLDQFVLAGKFFFATRVDDHDQIEVYAAQGELLYKLPLGSSGAMLNLAIVPMDSERIGVVYNGRTGYTWPQDPRFADVSPFPDDRPQLVGLEVDAATGTIRRSLLGTSNLEPRSVTLVTDDGVMRVEGAGGHLHLESFTWEGGARTSYYTSRVGGQCVHGTCPGGHVALVPGDDGRMHVFFQQVNAGELVVDRFTLISRWVPAYLRWNAFGE